MKYVNLSTTYYMDQAVQRLSPNGERFLTRALAYCGNAENRGTFTLSDAKMLGIPGTKSRISELVSAEILRENLDETWSFKKWDEWQESGNKLLERQERDRERQRKLREQSRDTSRDNPHPEERREEERVITDVITLGESSAKPVTTPASKPAARKRTATPPTRISEDWQPTREAVDKLRPDTPDVDLQRETANFVDYWLGKPGKAGEKQDWLATWRKWMRTAQTDIEARTARTAPRRPGYGGNTGPCHPNGVPLTSGEIKFAQAEALKERPNPEVLKLAGIPLSDKQRHNLGMGDSSDIQIIDATADDWLFNSPARAIS
ncbi:hypothetical protein [Rhodococcus qingshengii]|uniref:hypothetical protein n=1 Tax=Rhodococcus qingshengii TaxID=334542 RepID=UPI001C8B6512|nr:hypothetical protein [Rhodococcus qingshengii]MBX9150036.1 hypothetical protein [Rhodococcus qingshengii]